MEADHRRRLLPSCHDSLKYKAGILSYIRSLHFQVVVIQSLIRVVDIMRFQNSIYSFRYRDFLFDVFDITTLSNHKIVFGASFIESAGNLRFPAESAPKLRFSLDSPTPNRFPGSKSSDCFCFFSISDVVCCSKKFVGGLGVQPWAYSCHWACSTLVCGIPPLRHSWRKGVVGYPYCGIAAIRASALRNFPMLCEAFAKCGVPPLLPLAF